WGRQRKKFRTFGRRLRRRSARQPNGDKINVLQKPAVCQCDIAANCRRRKWSCYPDVRIGARGERIVSGNQHALSSELQIESWFSQFNERNATAHSKRPTSQIASEAIESECVVPKSDTCIKTPQRGKSRVGETGNVHRHVPCSTQDRMTKRSTHIHVESEIAVQLLEVRNELTNKIHRTARQPSLSGNWRVVGKSSGLDNFRHVEWHAGVYFQGLNPRLLQLAGSCQLILRGLRAQLERRRFHFLPLFVSQIPHLPVEPRFPICNCRLTGEPRIHDTRDCRLYSEIVRQPF